MANCSPLQLHKELIKKITPALRWDKRTPIEGWSAQCRKKLEELLGWDSFVKCEPDLQIISEEELNGNKHIHFLVQTEKGYYASCHLLLPPNAEKKLSLCVALQGHVSGAHLGLGIVKNDYDNVYLAEDGVDFCVQAINNGFAGLAIEQRGFGENGAPNGIGTLCNPPAMTALLLGRTLIGERVWDVCRVVDAVNERFGELVTMDGSVLVGMSGGGTATYYTACIDHRFEVYVPGVALCNFYDSIVEIDHCVCNYVPNMAKYFDMGDMAVMIAPKKLVVVSGKADRWFPLDGAIDAFSQIKEIYKAQNAENNCVQVIGNGGHSFYPKEAWEAINKLLSGVRPG